MFSSILKRLENLEKAFINNTRNQTSRYGLFDKADNKNAENTNINTSDITDNRDGLIETFDKTMINSSDISDCRTAIIELYDMLTGGNE